MIKNVKFDNVLWDYHQNQNRQHLLQGLPRQEMLLKYIKKYVPNGKILEIGFGNGYLLNKLILNGYYVYGQDISQNNINITLNEIKANNKLVETNLEFILGDTSGKIFVNDEHIDGFVASEVLEHMDDEELNECIKEIKRVLKKGGYAFITFPAMENLKNNECICPNCGTVFHKWGHKQSWDYSKIKDKFKDFEIVLVKTFFNRYVGKNFLETLIGYFMYFLRNILNKFVDLEGKSYLVIIKKL